MIRAAAAAFRPSPPNVPVRHWHISPGIDTLAYAFSWAWMLIPFLLSGPVHPTDYLWYWILGNTLSYCHRHLTMPYVYFDGQVFKTQVGRFLVVPSLLMAGFLASGLYRDFRVPKGFFDRTDALVAAAAVLLFLQWRRADALRWTVPAPVLYTLVALPLAVLGALLMWPGGVDHRSHALAIGTLLTVVSLWLARSSAQGEQPTSGFVRFGAPGLILTTVLFAGLTTLQPDAPLGPSRRLHVPMIVGGVAAIAGAWNIWHVYMQKYGILRMYAAKSGLPPEGRVPGWVDRLLVFGWLPAYLMYLPIAARPILQKQAPTVLPWLSPILDQLQAVATVGLPLAVVLGSASVALYFHQEWKTAGLRNPARLVMGLGTTLLALTFFVFDPFQAYVAYGFSHAVEYVVFVWAFQRRRYRQPLAHRPLLGRMLAWPIVYYTAFFLLIGTTYAVLEYGPGRLYDHAPRVFGTPVRSWIFYWTVWQSMAHFYFDSFLWKMRLPEVRASL